MMGLPHRTVSFRDLVGHPANDVEAKYAPSRLHVRGPLPLPLVSPRVSIVGTRHPSEDGMANAKRLASFLAKRGATIVSGLAAGIDTAAHRASMDDGGSTIAVLGTPLEKAYPAQNRALQDEIMQRHLVVSQFESGSATRPANFVMRNRTMALISDATVIVEAKAKSGTEHQGWEAIRLGRPLFLMETVPEIPWVDKLCHYGATRLHDIAYIEECLSLPEAVLA